MSHIAGLDWCPAGHLVLIWRHSVGLYSVGLHKFCVVHSSTIDSLAPHPSPHPAPKELPYTERDRLVPIATGVTNHPIFSQGLSDNIDGWPNTRTWNPVARQWPQGWVVGLERPLSVQALGSSPETPITGNFTPVLVLRLWKWVYLSTGLKDTGPVCKNAPLKPLCIEQIHHGRPLISVFPEIRQQSFLTYWASEAPQQQTRVHLRPHQIKLCPTRQFLLNVLFELLPYSTQQKTVVCFPHWVGDLTEGENLGNAPPGCKLSWTAGQNNQLFKYLTFFKIVGEEFRDVIEMQIINQKCRKKTSMVLPTFF